LAEDETKVKSRVAWDSSADHLTGFCGPKAVHKCEPQFKLVVGVGEQGYNNILDAFGTFTIVGFVRFIIVSPLHDKLPRLTLVVCCTCNCFDAAEVRKQWDDIDRLWETECLHIVGPIVGHASDGDSRKRQLMLQDYKMKGFMRLEVPWDGWVFSAGLHAKGDTWGLHD
jgi:hypothetical protein